MTTYCSCMIGPNDPDPKCPHCHGSGVWPYPPASPRFYYLASPYTHPSLLTRTQRAIDVNRYAGELMAAGLYVYAPIWATHEICGRHGLPVEHDWWIGFNKAFLDAAAGVIVCAIDGWRESRGVAQEIGYAREVGLPLWLATEEMGGGGLTCEEWVG